MSYVYKRTSNMTKSEINLVFLLRTRVEASEVISNSPKTLDYVTPIIFGSLTLANNVKFSL